MSRIKIFINRVVYLGFFAMVFAMLIKAELLVFDQRGALLTIKVFPIGEHTKKMKEDQEALIEKAKADGILE